MKATPALATNEGCMAAEPAAGGATNSTRSRLALAAGGQAVLFCFPMRDSR
jgi:hypothetical protein